MDKKIENEIEKNNLEKILGQENTVTTIIGVMLFLLLFVAMPIGFQLWANPDFDFSHIFFCIGIFVAAILVIGIQIMGIHFLLKLIQNKMHLKYQINFFKLFLTVVILIVLLLAIYALFMVPNASLSPFVKWFLPFVFIPAIIKVASCIVVKAENVVDKQSK